MVITQCYTCVVKENTTFQDGIHDKDFILNVTEFNQEFFANIDYKPLLGLMLDPITTTSICLRVSSYTPYSRQVRKAELKYNFGLTASFSLFKNLSFPLAPLQYLYCGGIFRCAKRERGQGWGVTTDEKGKTYARTKRVKVNN